MNEALGFVMMSWVDPYLLFLTAAGTFAGIYIGAIPGLSVTMAVSILISFTFKWQVNEALALAPSVALLETDGAFDLAAALGPRGFHIVADGEEHGARRWRAKLENGKGSRQLLQACVEAGAPLSLFEPARASLHEAFVALVGASAAVRE